MHTLRYLLRRILPFFALFMSVQLCVRLALLAREWHNIDISLFEGVKAFAVGALFDVAAFSFLIIPFLIHLLSMPAKRYRGRADRIGTSVFYVIFTYLILFNAVAEWLFWDEFATRFNFIAVDYLIYTNEVVGNIRESYPLPWLLSGIGLLTAIIFIISRKCLLPAVQIAPVFLQRLGGVILCLFAAALLYLGVDIRNMNVSQNQYANEISGDGIFSLFSAFWHNELDYKSFYLTHDEAEVSKRIHTLLAKKNARFAGESPDDITRIIRRAGPERHKNVILVVMESLSAEYMGTFGDTHGLTPNLDALAKESLFFSNLYATGTRTVRGLEAVTLSIPPTPGQSILRRPGNENLYSLGFVFQDRGYDTRFIYGGYGYFDNMNYFFEHNGFTPVDRAQFAKEEVHFANNWGVADEDLFHKTVQEADASYAAKKPFMHLVMTTSNHRPFTFPEGRIDLPSKTGGRFAAVKYTDYAVGKLIEEARTKPWFKDTVFVFVSDHTAGSAGKLALTPEKYHIPMMIYAPGFIAPKRVEAVASQIDLAPTLLGLLNFSYHSRFYGEDLSSGASEAPRAFISTYQKVALMKGGQVTILSPRRQMEAYRGETKLTPAEIEPSLVEDAVAYYQFASGWKERAKRVETVVK